MGLSSASAISRAVAASASAGSSSSTRPVLLLLHRHLVAHHKKGGTERLGDFKSPIVTQLWSRRSTAKELEMDCSPPSPPVERKPSESRTTVTYEFTKDPFLCQSYENPWGFFRKGKLLEDMDALAGNIAFKHCEKDGKVPLLVTASVDKIRLSINPTLDRDMEMAGQVVWTGSSSMQIDLEVRALPDTRAWINASFTFVARAPSTGKATAINRLEPETEVEKKLFQTVELKNQRRKVMRKAAEHGGTKIVGQHAPHHPGGFDSKAMIKLLLTQARPLLEMPCLADPTCVLVDSTRASNSTIMQPQQRNMLNRVFGGFLMRRAYEIAFSTCYLFAGARPEFYQVAHVDFLSPVDVGDLMRFDSAVLYTHTGQETGAPHVHVQVVASICRPESVQSSISNTFNFVFRVPSKATVRKVLPANLDQAKRMVDRMTADLEDE